MRAGKVVLAVLLLLSGGCRRKAADPLTLHRAVGKADRARILSLLAAGADINARDPLGYTPLHVAVDADHKRMVDLLIAQGANVDANEAPDGTPLHHAILYRHPGLVRSLLAVGANVNAKASRTRITPLQLAFMFRQVEVVALLLDGGADPDTRDEWNRTVLHAAAWGGDTELAGLFLAHGAQVNANQALFEDSCEGRGSNMVECGLRAPTTLRR